MDNAPGDVADPDMLVGMTFEDLPADWAQRPITDPEIFAGVVDLVVTDANRRHGAVYVLLTHPDGRMLQPIAVEGVPPGAPSVAAADRWTGFLRELAEQGARCLVIALARVGPARIGPDDEAFFAVLRAAARRAGLELLGLAVATPAGVLVLDTDGPDGLAHPA